MVSELDEIVRDFVREWREWERRCSVWQANENDVRSLPVKHIGSKSEGGLPTLLESRR